MESSKEKWEDITGDELKAMLNFLNYLRNEISAGNISQLPKTEEYKREHWDKLKMKISFQRHESN